jgi:hypothetical protein
LHLHGVDRHVTTIIEVEGHHFQQCGPGAIPTQVQHLVDAFVVGLVEREAGA